MRMMSNWFWWIFFSFSICYVGQKDWDYDKFKNTHKADTNGYKHYELFHEWNFHNCPYHTSSRIIDRYISCKCWLSFKSPSIYQSTQITFLANLRYFYPSWKHAFAIIHYVFSYQGIANDDRKERKKGTVYVFYYIICIYIYIFGSSYENRRLLYG